MRWVFSVANILTARLHTSDLYTHRAYHPPPRDCSVRRKYRDPNITGLSRLRRSQGFSTSRASHQLMTQSPSKREINDALNQFVEFPGLAIRAAAPAHTSLAISAGNALSLAASPAAAGITHRR